SETLLLSNVGLVYTKKEISGLFWATHPVTLLTTLMYKVVVPIPPRKLRETGLLPDCASCKLRWKLTVTFGSALISGISEARSKVSVPFAHWGGSCVVGVFA